MKTKLIVAIMLTSLLAGMLAVVPIRQVAAAGNATLSINPPTISSPPGAVDSFFDVYLDVNTDTGLFGFDLNVTWADDTLINLDYLTSNATTATLLDGVWGVGKWFLVKSESGGGGGGGGGGYYRVAALSTQSASTTGIHSLTNLHFQIKKGCNFLLHTHITIDRNAKLSDINYSPITVTAYNDGYFEITATKPDLEFVLVEPDTHLFEYCKIFRIEVYVSHICVGSPLTDYDFNITYNTELLKFTDVYSWGELGTGHCTNATGIIHIWDDPGGLSKWGDRFLLFTLTFHIEFDDRIEHIWRVGGTHSLTAIIAFLNAELSFDLGTVTDITMPGAQNILVNLIRGDVDCNGKVNVFDLRTVAACYDQTTPVKYDLTVNGIIDIFDLVAVATNFGYGGP
jgi:hypothetical protein